MPSPFDPLVLLSKQSKDFLSKSGSQVIADPYLLTIDEAYSDLCGLITSSPFTPVEAAEPLIQNISNLLKYRLESFKAIGAGLNWHYFVQNIARLLFERIALLEEQHSSNCIINTESELLNGIALREAGFFSIQLTSEEISKFKEDLKPILSVLKSRVIEGHSSRVLLSENKIPRSIVQRLNSVFGRSGIISSVNLGIGAFANVSGFSLEISVPQAAWWANRFPEGQNKPARTAYFHRDECCFVPKAVLYLSDVDDDSGPFSVCPTSFKEESSPVVAAASRVFTYPQNLPGYILDTTQFTHFILNLPEALRVTSHYGFDLPDDTPASSAILNNEKSYYGNSGTCIVFDGYNLLHRGGLCRKKARVALQIMLPVHISSLDKWMRVLQRIQVPN